MYDFASRYVTALYYTVTTATTVGYGDVSARNSREKLYMIFLEFIGICTFSVITGNILNLKRADRVSDIV